MAADVTRDGLESVLSRAAQRLRDSDRVLTHDAVNKFFADDPDYARLIDLANGCDVPVHADFVPNFGEGATMRGNNDADPSAPLLVHALRDAAAGLVIILPLSVAAAAAKKEGIKLHVSENII